MNVKSLVSVKVESLLRLILFENHGFGSAITKFYS